MDLDSWYRIGTPESHTYGRAECCPYAGFFLDILRSYLLRLRVPIVKYLPESGIVANCERQLRDSDK